MIGKLNIAKPSFASNIHFHPHFIRIFIDISFSGILSNSADSRASEHQNKSADVLVGPKHLDQHGETHFETEPDVLERKKSLVKHWTQKREKFR